MRSKFMADVIDAFLAAGFVPDGQTREKTVRIPTRNSPLLGRSGGELAKLGGQQRFVLPGTNIKARSASALWPSTEWWAEDWKGPQASPHSTRQTVGRCPAC